MWPVASFWSGADVATPTIIPDATAQRIGPTMPHVCGGSTRYRVAYATPEAFETIAKFDAASSAMAARAAVRRAMADLDRAFGR